MGLKDLFAAHANEQEAEQEHTIKVEGMHCNGCEKLMCAALEERGASKAQANFESGKVTYCGDLSNETVAEAVASAGFKLAAE